jgi:uncharacterized small protein (DUF1192 family)
LRGVARQCAAALAPEENAMTISTFRDELESQRRKLLNRTDQIIERALCRLVRSVFDEVDACKRVQQARELRDEWRTAVFTEVDELAAALEREIERADAALLWEVKKASESRKPSHHNPN